ncbi:MAG: NusA N-terminal domain-containing protein, partial [Fimbriimonadaceae bacterium]
MSQLTQIAQEREIPVDELLVEIEASLAVAYKKFIGIPNEIDIEVNVTIGGPKGMSATIAKEVVGT